MAIEIKTYLDNNVGFCIIQANKSAKNYQVKAIAVFIMNGSKMARCETRTRVNNSNTLFEYKREVT